jgi:hypothetical protein
MSWRAKLSDDLFAVLDELATQDLDQTRLTAFLGGMEVALRLANERTLLLNAAREQIRQPVWEGELESDAHELVFERLKQRKWWPR